MPGSVPTFGATSTTKLKKNSGINSDIENIIDNDKRNAEFRHRGCFLCGSRFKGQKKFLIKRKNVDKKKVMNSNEDFNLGGLPNELSPIAEKVYHNVYSKNLQRQVGFFLCSSHGMPKLGLDFNKERSHCLEEKKLFEDPEFPASDESLFMKIEGRTYPSVFQTKHGGYIWKRPGELVANPRFIVADQSRFDVTQGILSDCCLSACASTLAMHEQLLYRVVPLDQSFTENYAGIFHFQFWHYGEWVDVVIDDRLPTKNNFLVFIRSEQRNEFWSALLEKAYAKLWGSYEAIADGCLADIMEDMTGGIVENFQINRFDKFSLYEIVQSAYSIGSFITCGISLENNHPENGLVPGHAYGVTSMAKVKYYGGEVPLIRIRNPWGNAAQWMGPFSDKAPEWDIVSKDEKKKLLVVKDDGEFWMVWDDFIQQFTSIHICLLGQQSIREIRDMSGGMKKKVFGWLSVEFHSEWSARNGTAGGLASGNMACNPQYTIRIPNNDDNETQLIIEVMQKHEKETKGKYVKKIGFAMLLRERKLNKVEQKDIQNIKDWTISPTFLQDRQTVKRITLANGDYCLIVSTENGNQDGEFILRILSKRKIDVRQFV